MNWILPPGVSTFAADIDGLYYLILVITGIAFVVTEVALVVFLIKYRARPGRRAVYTHGSTKAEIIWPDVTTVTVVVIGLMSEGGWKEIKGRDSVPEALVSTRTQCQGLDLGPPEIDPDTNPSAQRRTLILLSSRS